MVKDGIEDIRRHRSDHRVNRELIVVVRDGCFSEIPTEQLVVGDFVMLQNNSEVPADCLLLSSSNENGMSFINTMNLDGETNIKLKQSHPDLVRRLGLVEVGNLPERKELKERVFLAAMKSHNVQIGQRVSHLRGTLRLSPPTRHLSSFAGSLDLDEGEESERIVLSLSNLLLKGSFIKTTRATLGLVVYTGKDTKVRLNTEKTANKFSTLQRAMNQIIILLTLFLFSLTIISVIFGLMYRKNSAKHPYLFQGTMTAKDIVVLVISFMIYYSYTVPMSLFVIVEVGHAVQGLLMEKDKQMWHLIRSENDEELEGDEKIVHATVRASSLTDELGVVEHVFTDKTGTLTANEMTLVGCGIGTQLYSVGNGDWERREKGGDQPEHKFSEAVDLFVDMTDPNTRDQQRMAKEKGSVEYNTLHFVNCLLLCHDVYPETERDEHHQNEESDQKRRKDRMDDRPSPSPSPLIKERKEARQAEFQSTSPDEVALLTALAALGIRLISRTGSCVVLSVRGREVKVDVLARLEFSSERGRMSVVVRLDNDEVRVYTKGSDAAIVGLCSTGTERQRAEMDETEQAEVGEGELEMMRKQLEVHSGVLAGLEELSGSGLRTMCVSTRSVGETEYKEWKTELDKAINSLSDREERIEECFVQLERRMELIGCTGVLDRLEDECVPTLEMMKAAGLTVWMLTGDKVNTAVSIGQTCGLLSNEGRLIRLTKTELEERGKAQLGEARDRKGRPWRRSSDDSSIQSDGLDLSQTRLLHGKSASVGSLLNTSTSTVDTYGTDGTGRVLKDGSARREGDVDESKLFSRQTELRRRESSFRDGWCLGPRRRRRMEREEREMSSDQAALLQIVEDMIVEGLMGVGDTWEDISKTRNGYSTPKIGEKKKKQRRRDARRRWNRIEKGSMVIEDSLLAENEREGEVGLVVDGFLMNCILQTVRLQTLFLRLASVANGVICSRISPIQKALVVRMVKEHTGSKCLAVGDGANDVSMIEEADVGVGIVGREGMQASQSSDFAVGSIGDLRRLLFVHGWHNLSRLSTTIQYCFYKNMAFVVGMFVYNVFSQFTSQPPFGSSFPALYNMIYTSLPIVVTSIQDKVLTDRELESFPRLYSAGRRKNSLTRLGFTPWVVLAVFQGLMIFFVQKVFFAGDGLFVDSEPTTLSHWEFTMSTNLVLIVTITVVWSNHLDTAFFVGSWVASLIAFVLLSIATTTLGMFTKTPMAFLELFASPRFYLCVAMTVVVSVVPLIVVSAIRDLFSTSPITVTKLYSRQQKKEQNSDNDSRFFPQ
ncbi:phospholipid-transporting P-type ATPase [Blattamonas nauphoetae]|uniref:Phospholipid-transporting P-type ATPase n=1 Tax=Blattamonas nauphoetae TaxID=2049346 RepID=A0ABQ9XJ54_9EUKA|nr:phospholipid-transporting P-type ATPase [Blattamonas nauphoetae]